LLFIDTSDQTLALDRNVQVNLVCAVKRVVDFSSYLSLGLPLGLGAGFKLIDKDKEKDRESSLELEPIPPYGWTAILEDWYCQAGSAHVIDRKRGFRNVPHIPGTSIPSMRSTPNLKRKSMSKAQQERKGPYEILIKERMMGLYLAVFIHRDIKHLVRGRAIIWCRIFWLMNFHQVHPNLPSQLV
jgi:hypothetical protein